MPGEICLITSIYPPESGGPAKFSFDFAQWLAESGHPVRVITYSNKNKLRSQAGIKIIAIKNGKFIFLRYLRMSWAIWKYSRSATSVLVAGAFVENLIASIFYRNRYVSKIPGDIVWERARNNRVTNLEIIEFQDSPLPWKYTLFRFLFRKSIKGSSGIIAPSKFINSLVQGWGIEESKIETVYNSILVDEQAPPRNSQTRYDVLTVARLVPWKGVSELIEICADLNLTLCVVGDGPEKQNLINLADEVNGKVEFLGHILPSQMQSIYSKSRIFVLNSSYEGLPHVLLEARKAGVMTIAKSGTGSEEVINHGQDGLLVGENLPMSLKDALIWANLHSDECFEYTKNALADLKTRFNQDVNFLKTLNVLNREQFHGS